jgi:hypothetical protein
MQTLIVLLLVAACSLYAAWTLMPAAARRPLAGALLKFPLPEAVVRRLRRAAAASTGCGCDGCDAAPPPGAKDVGAVQVVTFHPRRKA